MQGAPNDQERGFDRVPHGLDPTAGTRKRKKNKYKGGGEVICAPRTK